jgi:hypothetical protein
MIDHDVTTIRCSVYDAVLAALGPSRPRRRIKTAIDRTRGRSSASRLARRPNGRPTDPRFSMT